MAQITTLKDKTGTTLYPVTSAQAVFDDKGVDLETSLQQKQDTITTPDGNLALSPDGQLSLTDLAKKRLFIDLFNTAADTYGYARIIDGKFDCELNGLKLTYEEAVEIYGRHTPTMNLAQQYSLCKARTNIPIRRQWGRVNIERVAEYNTAIEVYRNYCNIDATNLTACFYGCTSLTELTLALEPNAATKDISAFSKCPSLTTVLIKGLKGDISFPDSPLITSESFHYIVDNAAKASTFTITVHPDVYTKLTDENNIGWHQLLLSEAAAKNIQFATI